MHGRREVVCSHGVRDELDVVVVVRLRGVLSGVGVWPEKVDAVCAVADATVWRSGCSDCEVVVLPVMLGWPWVSGVVEPLCGPRAWGHVRVGPDKCPLVWPGIVVSLPLPRVWRFHGMWDVRRQVWACKEVDVVALVRTVCGGPKVASALWRAVWWYAGCELRGGCQRGCQRLHRSFPVLRVSTSSRRQIAWCTPESNPWQAGLCASAGDNNPAFRGKGHGLCPSLAERQQ